MNRIEKGVLIITVPLYVLILVGILNWISNLPMEWQKEKEYQMRYRQAVLNYLEKG